MLPDEPTPDPVDLSMLTPRLDAARFESLVATAMQRNAAELARRRARPTLALVVVGWRRPVMSFAGLAAAAAVALFVMPARSASTTGTRTTTVRGGETAAVTFSYAAQSDTSVAALLGVPADYAPLVEGTRAATARTAP